MSYEGRVQALCSKGHLTMGKLAEEKVSQMLPGLLEKATDKKLESLVDKKIRAFLSSTFKERT